MKRFLLENVAAVAGAQPSDNDGTAITGDAVDRTGYQSALLVVSWADPSPTSNAVTALIRIEDAAASTYGTFKTLETALSLVTGGIKYYPIDLAGAKKNIRVYIDSTYTNGSSPKNIIATAFILGDKDGEPVSTTVYSK